MKKVERSELLDYQTYHDGRNDARSKIMAIKRPRRIHVGSVLTFLFENTDTIRYQIQEMMRVERIVKEASIQHELDTYNAVLGGVGELGCALLIEIDDSNERAEKLSAWLDLPEHLYVALEDGRRVRPRFDPRQVGEDRLSAVQYLIFDTGGEVPVAVGSDLPDLTVEARLTNEQRSALAADLSTA